MAFPIVMYLWCGVVQSLYRDFLFGIPIVNPVVPKKDRK